VLRAPELDAGLQVGSHQSRAEGQNPLPRPAAHAASDAAQDAVGLLGCECTLSDHVWSTLSSSGLPSSRKMRSYWRESSGGLRGW